MRDRVEYVPITSAHIVGVRGQFAGISIQVPNGGIMMGRDPVACHVVFNAAAPGVSRHHCVLNYNLQTNMFILNDCGSSVGTFLANGMKLGNGQAVAMNPGERFYLGSPNNMFECRV